jgi:hypothetical protein
MCQAHEICDGGLFEIEGIFVDGIDAFGAKSLIVPIDGNTAL